MYVPSHFAENDRAVQLGFIQEHGWGYLVGIVDCLPVVTHLPFLVEGENGEETLVAHMARANAHWQSFADGREQLVVIPGPHAYVSPSWYKTRQAVPTWNYAAVHVYGVPQVVDDPAAIRRGQKALVDHYESTFDTPWRMEALDDVYVTGMLRSIVSFRVPITRIEAKFKLSQNRTAADRQGVIAALEASAGSGPRGIASMMRRREPAEEA